jgi:putative transposase
LGVCTGFGGVTEVVKQGLLGSVCPPTLKVPQKQPKRGRLWLNDGSCVRLRLVHKGHVWSYDFVQDRTHEGKVFRMLCIIDEFTRECLAIRVERRLNSRDVLDELGELFVRHGPPEHIRSDNGPEFIATALREWLGRLGTKTLYIEPGSPWAEAEQKRLCLREPFPADGVL